MKNKAFRKIPLKGPQRSAIDLSHEKKMSFQMGQLIPIYLQPDVLPSDKFRVSSEVLVRLAPILAPLMHRIDVFIHYFFVANRLIWDDWEDFITGGEDGDDESVPPYCIYNNAERDHFDKGKLSDYMGIPPTDVGTITQFMNISMLPFRAYYEIFNEFYRDQNLVDKMDFVKTGGNDTAGYYDNDDCRNRALERDYFTSCLPTAQRGNDVELDLDVGYSTFSQIKQDDNTYPTADSNILAGPAGQTNRLQTAADGDARIENISSVTLEITELRRAARLLEFLEKTNIGGARYNESMLMHFGQRSSDARLQRPEYLGGGKAAVQISEVLNTSAVTEFDSDDVITPQGNMAGKGIAISKTNRFTKTFEEHGIILGIMSVMPRTAYQEGIEKFWNKTDRTEYFWPSFAQLGEQEVLQSEIYWDPVGSDKDDTFGYQSRYAEYKWARSSVHGDFIDDFDYWHMGRILGSAPTLNQAFIGCESTDYDRVFAVEQGTVHKFYAQIYNDVQAVRPIPEFNRPTL